MVELFREGQEFSGIGRLRSYYIKWVTTSWTYSMFKHPRKSSDHFAEHIFMKEKENVFMALVKEKVKQYE